MYYLLALLSGVLLSITILFNGELSNVYGLYASTVIIHFTGLILISAAVVVKRDKPFAKKQHWFLYLGGAIGFITLGFTNFAYGRISSVSAILAIGLMGQSVTALFVDRYGLWGMPKYPFYKGKVIGLFFILLGVVSMINEFDFFAVALVFASGFTAVLARTLNARLADLTSVRISTLFNYITGLTTAIVIFLIFGHGEPIYSDFVLSPNWYIYFGGAIGVVFIAISNMVVTRISAFSLSLFLFIGQVFSGIVIDGLILGEFSIRILIGGVLVTVGLVIDLISGKKVYSQNKTVE